MKRNPVDAIVHAISAAALVLVLPVSLLLFAQWPLREWVQAYSREANDLAQWLFALYVSVAITYATRRGSHLAADAFAQRYSPATCARLVRIAALAVLLPWSLYLLYAGWPALWQSLAQRERFPDTFNPGYFIIKLSVGLLALLVLLQSLLDLVLGPQREDD